MKIKARTELFAGLVIFILTCSIFISFPQSPIADSKYSMLVDETLLHHGTFTLDRYAFDDFGKQNTGGWGGIYQLELPAPPRSGTRNPSMSMNILNECGIGSIRNSRRPGGIEEPQTKGRTKKVLGIYRPRLLE
ncbi:MAG TPA: hypothetical protein VLQ90_10230 [Pyrinomonadaceae bacterium]|nr:hypothetical protein [Pyrinomonadaceae bacterium]